MKKKKKKKQIEESPDKSLKKLEDEVAEFNPEFVKWLRSRKPTKKDGK